MKWEQKEEKKTKEKYEIWQNLLEKLIFVFLFFPDLPSETLSHT